METSTVEQTLVTKECGECYILFAVPYHFEQECKERKRVWYCPNGHSRQYVDSDISRLKHRIKTLEWESAELRERAEEWKRKEAAQRGQATRARNRARAGVCQFCNRTFQNVARHMKSQHAEGE